MKELNTDQTDLQQIAIFTGNKPISFSQELEEKDKKLEEYKNTIEEKDNTITECKTQ